MCVSAGFRSLSYVLKLRPARYIHRISTLRTTRVTRGVVQGSSAVQQCSLHITMSSSTLESLLGEHTFEQHSVEYAGYLFNHICHGIISLYRLGADEARIKRFVEWYTPRLEDVEERKNSEQEHVMKSLAGSGDDKPVATGCTRTDDTTLASIAKLRGRGSSFYFILGVFEKELAASFEGSVKVMLRSFYPGLIRGIAGSAFHGIIHLGYGCAAENSRLITEGVAYLHYCYLPLTLSQSMLDKLPLQSLGNGPCTVEQVLEEIRNDHELRTFLSVQSNDPALVAREVNRFERPLRVLLTQRGDTLLEYVHRIKLPMNINSADVGGSTESLDQLFKWVIDVALTVYSKSEHRNDFFLLHGVTSAFSLREINSFISIPDKFDAPSSTTCPTQVASEGVRKYLEYLDTVSSPTRPTEVALEAVRTYLCTLLSAYLVQGAPTLIEDTTHDWSKGSWEELKSKALGKDYDEHVYKLLQICFELDAETKDPAIKKMYKNAVNIALEHEFIFHPNNE